MEDIYKTLVDIINNQDSSLSDKNIEDCCCYLELPYIESKDFMINIIRYNVLYSSSSRMLYLVHNLTKYDTKNNTSLCNAIISIAEQKIYEKEITKIKDYSISKIPPEILNIVFNYIPTNIRLALVRLVCRDWNRIVNDSITKLNYPACDDRSITAVHPYITNHFISLEKLVISNMCRTMTGCSREHLMLADFIQKYYPPHLFQGVSKNRVTFLTASIDLELLKKIKCLTIKGCVIKSYTITSIFIEKFLNITSLTIVGCHLKTLPIDINLMSHLTSLDVSYNKITRLGFSKHLKPKLTSIKLNNNPQLKDLSPLQHVPIKHLEIKKIHPAGFSSLIEKLTSPQLETLKAIIDVQNVQVVSLYNVDTTQHDFLRGQTNLRSLSIYLNYPSLHKKQPYTFENTNYNIHTLKLYNNSLDVDFCDFRTFTNLTSLSIDLKKLFILKHTECLAKLRTLEMLNVLHIEYSYGEMDGLHICTNLTKLTLRDARFANTDFSNQTSLENIFKIVPHLISVGFKECIIPGIPSAISILTRLQILNLYKTEDIWYIPPVLNKMTSLKKLKLSQKAQILNILKLDLKYSIDRGLQIITKDYDLENGSGKKFFF